MLGLLRRRDSESVPAAVAAYSGVRRVQGAWSLSRLLVLDTARATAAISASVETESSARIRREIWAEHPGRDRTYYGEMVAAMKSRFDRVYSIECVPALAERAMRKFARDEHVRIFCGDSRVVMPEVLALLQGPALFWLDAGYYGWVGRQGDQQRLSAELEMILSHPYPHMILLDDARGLTGRDGIPSVSDVKAYVESKFPQRSIAVEFDIMRITLRE